MNFGEYALPAAEGGRLAHTIRLPGLTLPKGTLLDRAALDRLRQANVAIVTAALLAPGDIHEDDAARRVATALTGANIACSRVSTGRANLVASTKGLFQVDPATVEALNLLDEGLTVGTLPDAAAVAPGDMLATVKIIPFAVPASIIQQAESLAARRKPLQIRPFRPLRVGLVLTTLPGLKDGVIRGTIKATSDRISALGGTMLPEHQTAHASGPIASALIALIRAGADLLLIAGASATVDRGDVGPSAICAAGGTIDHFGMPVDPGNLICLGHIGPVPAIVLPGCARSPKLNGVDLVLHRIFAGETPSRTDIARMGVGGLLKDTLVRPSPRIAAAPVSRRVAAVVLAAGRSSRMTPHHKLLMRGSDGRSMVCHAVDAVMSSKVSETIVVLGHQADQVSAALAGRPVRLVHAPDFDAGMSASLRSGLAGLSANTAAALVCLADMPLVDSRMIDRLIDAFDPDLGHLIVVPVHRGKRGNPVLWDRRFFPDMMALQGDTGARGLLTKHAEYVVECEMETDAILRDFDTPGTAAGWPG